MDAELLARAKAFLAHDPEAETQAELAALIARVEAGDAAARADLSDRFAGPLEFGTAGLRGVLGAGETRMNVAVILRTSHGLGQFLLATPQADARARGVAIGYDGRRKSRLFAEACAGALAALGIPSWLSPTLCPTPVTAYAVTRLGCAAGVMVTASHNPPEYNGFKVYWGNGAQIVPPVDRGIAAAIAEAPPADEVPRLAFDDARGRALVRDFPEDLESSYLAAVQRLALGAPGDRDARIVYTALHGVGDRLVRETLARAGFRDVTSVPEQAEPDGAFPTVSFPNPEEKGALDLALALAEARGADLILASDPDVDRLAVAVRTRAGAPGFTQLSGNQVGVLLGHYLLTEGPGGGDRLVLASCVSSPQLGAVARALGVAYEETLTGFKWIANRGMELEREGKRVVFGYEEALGYTVGALVRDKDGISAALLFAELWAARRAQGKTIEDELERIARRFGLFESAQISVTLKGQEGLAKIQAVMAALRAGAFDSIGGLQVEATRDVKAGLRRARDGATTSLALPSSDVLVFDLEGQSRVVARPSGTEPKLKIYVDVREPVTEGEPIEAARGRARARIEELKRDIVSKAGL